MDGGQGITDHLLPKKRKNRVIPPHRTNAIRAEQVREVHPRVVRTIRLSDEDRAVDCREHRKIVLAIAKADRLKGVGCVAIVATVALDQVPTGPALITWPHQVMESPAFRAG